MPIAPVLRNYICALKDIQVMTSLAPLKMCFVISMPCKTIIISFVPLYMQFYSYFGGTQNILLYFIIYYEKANEDGCIWYL